MVRLCMVFHITNTLHDCMLCAVCPENAHPSCRLENSLRFKPGSGCVDGEAVERFWKNAGGAAYAAEKNHVSRFAETYVDVFSLVNFKMLVSIPPLITRMAQRAHQAFVKNRQDLCDLCHELTTKKNIKLSDDVLKAWTVKVLRDSSGDLSNALSPGAMLFGAIEELEAKKLVLSSLQVARLYGNAGEAKVLKSTQRAINQLEKLAQKSRQEVPQDYQPTSSDTTEFRTKAVRSLTAQIIHKEAELLAAQGSVQRGTNAMVHLHPKEKARNRKTIENMGAVLMELKGKLSLHLSKLDPSAAVQIDSVCGLPTIVMMRLVTSYQEMNRSAEALCAQLPSELISFSETCGARASALRLAAGALGASEHSRFEYGEKALFGQRAAFFEALQKVGLLAFQVLPTLPSMDATMQRMCPWIAQSLGSITCFSSKMGAPGTFLPFQEDTSQAYRCFVGCTCALSNAHAVCEPADTIRPLVSLPAPPKKGCFSCVSVSGALEADAQRPETNFVILSVSSSSPVPI